MNSIALSQTSKQRNFAVFFGVVLCIGSLYFFNIAWEWYSQYGYDGFLVGMTSFMGIALLGVGILLIVHAWRLPVERTRTFAELDAADFSNHDPALVGDWLNAVSQAKRVDNGFPKWLFILAILMNAFGGLIFKILALPIWIAYLYSYFKNVRPLHTNVKRLQQMAGIDRTAIAAALNQPQHLRQSSW